MTPSCRSPVMFITMTAKEKFSLGRQKMPYYSLFTEPPSFQSKLENVTILSSSGSSLLCQAEHGPASVITWYKSRGGMSLQMLQNSTSVVYNYDTYSRLDDVKCVASNSFGSDNKRLLVNTTGMSKVVPFILWYKIFIVYVCVWKWRVIIAANFPI